MGWFDKKEKFVAKFKSGDCVQHKLNKERFMIICLAPNGLYEYAEGTYKVRDYSLNIRFFREFELDKVEE